MKKQKKCKCLIVCMSEFCPICVTCVSCCLGLPKSLDFPIDFIGKCGFDYLLYEPDDVVERVLLYGREVSDMDL